MRSITASSAALMHTFVFPESEESLCRSETETCWKAPVVQLLHYSGPQTACGYRVKLFFRHKHLGFPLPEALVVFQTISEAISDRIVH